MKKAAVILLLFISLFVAACSKNGNTKKAIDEVNRNCDVPFGLTLPESDLPNTDGYTRQEGFGGYMLENDDISFVLGGYPDVLDEYHIVGYQIKSPTYSLMGLTVGCSIEEADEVMRQHGYTVSTEDIWWSRYSKNGVKIGVALEGDAVAVFHVSVEVTNKENVVF